MYSMYVSKREADQACERESEVVCDFPRRSNMFDGTSELPTISGQIDTSQSNLKRHIWGTPLSTCLATPSICRKC